MKPTTAELLRNARLMNGLTARDVSILAEVPQSTISRIESGERSPGFDLMRKILNAIGFEASDQLRPSTTDAQLFRVMREMEANVILDTKIYERARIAGQASKIIDRPSYRRVDASMAEVVDWAKGRSIDYAISGLEAWTEATSARPIVYFPRKAQTPWIAADPLQRGTILLEFDAKKQEIARESNGVVKMPEMWAIMDSIAAPGRQPDVALNILEQAGRQVA